MHLGSHTHVRQQKKHSGVRGTHMPPAQGPPLLPETSWSSRPAQHARYLSWCVCCCLTDEKIAWRCHFLAWRPARHGRTEVRGHAPCCHTARRAGRRPLRWH
eukprot:scaffold122646_cov30-Tisochrysis_lutea.AAC.6